MTLDCSTAGLATASARESREIDQLARRMHEAHPGVPLATLTEFVEQAFAELAQARVQSYRLVLTERVARVRLADLGRSGPEDLVVGATAAPSNARSKIAASS